MNTDLIKSTIQSSHAVIIDIPVGFGYDYLISQLSLPTNAEVIKVLPRIHNTQKTENINAEDVIEIQEKTRGASRNLQIYFILGAEKMSEVAQNKFLKLLEEPRNNLHFVLVTSLNDKILTTIKSRSQYLKIEPISLFESQKLIKKLGIKDTKAKQILFLANGLPEEITKLSLDAKYFKFNLEIMDLAKRWISGSSYQRIVITSRIKTDRVKALAVTAKIIEILGKTISPDNAVQSTRQARKLLLAHKKINQNGNIRLCLLEAIFA